MTKTIRYSDLRANLADYLDQAASFNGEPIVVERRGKAPVALIDSAELSSIIETLHLLSSPANAKALFESLEQAKTGKAERFESVEQFIKVQRGKVPNRVQR